jgi:UTP--glucose-1-phosphate uridylyltransferase
VRSLAELSSWLPAAGQIAYTRQQRPLGLGHAVWSARHLVGDEPSAVVLVDDLMVCDPPCLKQMVDVYARIGGNVVAVVEVPREHTRRYGVLDIVDDDGTLAWAGAWSKSPTQPTRRLI